VAYLLKARTVEPEKQLLLANSSETTFISMQWLGKHVPVATDMHTMTEVLLETVFSTRSVQKDYKEDNWANQVSSVWEAVNKRDSWKRAGRERPFREELSAEAEESPLLEAIAREELVKTQQAGKVLAGGAVICELWRSATAMASRV
jgi:hypothetical protein